MNVFLGVRVNVCNVSVCAERAWSLSLTAPAALL